MLSIGVRETEHIAGNLQEIFVSISVPRHPIAQHMLKTWHKRPQDGFRMNRDIPASTEDSPLHHVIVWHPSLEMRDFCIHYVGAALHGTDIPPQSLKGRAMSDLLCPELFAYQRHICPQILNEDRIESLDIGRYHNGFEYMHYEMMMFRVLHTDNTPRLVTGLFYF